MSRGVAAAAIVLSLLVGVLLFATRTKATSPSAAPAGGDALSGRAGPGLVRAPKAAPAAPDAPPTPPPELAPLPAGVQPFADAVFALQDAGDPVAVGDAITALARRVCGDVAASKGVLDRALHAPALSARAARAALLALGRCGEEATLRDLVEALRDPKTRTRDRTSLVIALAQQRGTELHQPDGSVSMGMGDATLSGPIRERYVLDALLELLAPPPKSPLGVNSSQAEFRAESERSNVRITAIQVLGLSAGDFDDVLDALAALVKAEPGLRSIVLGSLAGARSSARLTAFVRPIVEDRSADEGSLQTALGRWMQSDRTAAVDYVLSEIASADVPDARKAVLIRHSSFFGAGSDAIPDIERLTLSGVAWARAHPRVVTGHEQDGPNLVPIELDMLAVADSMTPNAYRMTNGRSDLLRRPAAEAFVELLSRKSTKEEHRRPPRWLGDGFEGDDAYVLLVLDGLRTAPLDDETLLDLADVLTVPRPGRPPRSAPIAAAIRRFLDGLPPAIPERLTARRAPK